MIVQKRKHNNPILYVKLFNILPNNKLRATDTQCNSNIHALE
jgi:hypothetical protein